MKYDDAGWHYGGQFPADLPPEAGSTHIGMFLAWCLLHDLGAAEPVADVGGGAGQLRERTLTPGGFLRERCDEKFLDVFLDAEGNAFARAYYGGADDDDPCYVRDYQELFGVAGGDVYRVPDTWESYDRLAGRVDQRHREWVAAGRPAVITGPGSHEGSRWRRTLSRVWRRRGSREAGPGA